MSELENLMNESRWNRSLTPARVAMALIFSFFLWSGFVPLEEVAIATGEIIPRGKVKVIQHLEGGIIREIFIHEGSHVSAGDPLIQLDLSTTGVSRKELDVQIGGLKLKRARLLAEAHGSALVFPADIAEQQKDLLEQERRAYHARQNELTSLVRILHKQTRQREQDVAELRTRKAGITKELKLARTKLKMADDLATEGLLSQMDHVQLEREVAQLEAELGTYRSAIPRSQSALSEAQEHENEQRLKFQRSAQEDLSETDLKIARLEETLSDAIKKDERTSIQSPIAGTVQNLRHHTIGGVVRPGEPIMEIVPTEEKLVVNAKLSPLDRGYVKEGQPARVKVSSYDFVRYGALDGKVVNVAADSTSDSKGGPYFEVVVETDKPYLGTDDAPLPITSGMQAVVDIHTGRKSLLQYLIRPVLKLRYEAMRER